MENLEIKFKLLKNVYFKRELLIYSLEDRRIELLTISSYRNISDKKEENIKNLFPEN